MLLIIYFYVQAPMGQPFMILCTYRRDIDLLKSTRSGYVFM